MNAFFSWNTLQTRGIKTVDCGEDGYDASEYGVAVAMKCLVQISRPVLFRRGRVLATG